MIKSSFSLRLSPLVISIWIRTLDFYVAEEFPKV